jgi:hypothetical protein
MSLANPPGWIPIRYICRVPEVGWTRLRSLLLDAMSSLVLLAQHFCLVEMFVFSVKMLPHAKQRALYLES